MDVVGEGLQAMSSSPVWVASDTYDDLPTALGTVDSDECDEFDDMFDDMEQDDEAEQIRKELKEAEGTCVVGPVFAKRSGVEVIDDTLVEQYMDLIHGTVAPVKKQTKMQGKDFRRDLASSKPEPTSSLHQKKQESGQIQHSEVARPLETRVRSPPGLPGQIKPPPVSHQSPPVQPRLASPVGSQITSPPIPDTQPIKRVKTPKLPSQGTKAYGAYKPSQSQSTEPTTFPIPTVSAPVDAIRGQNDLRGPILFRIEILLRDSTLVGSPVHAFDDPEVICNELICAYSNKFCQGNVGEWREKVVRAWETRKRILEIEQA